MVLLNRRVLLIDFFLEKLYDKIQIYLGYFLYFLNIGHILFVSHQGLENFGMTLHMHILSISGRTTIYRHGGVGQMIHISNFCFEQSF